MANEYSVAALIASENLPGLVPAAGRESLGNRIVNVNTIDNLDVFDWLRAGDFLLTTGFLYKDDPTKLVEVIETVSRIGCAGLGIKTARYFDELPREVIHRADELSFPIIEIPLKYSLSDIANTVTDALRSNDEVRFTKYLSIHNSFNECVLNGGGVKALIDALHGYVNNPVALVDSRWRVLASCGLEGALHRLGLKSLVFPDSFIESIPTRLIGKTKLITRTFPAAGADVVTRIASLEDGSANYGYVVVFETDHVLDWIEFVALESVAVPLVVERIKAKQISEVKHQLRQDFFDDLLSGRINSVNAVSSLAEIHHMDIRKTYMCMVTRLDEDYDSDGGEEKRNRLFKVKNEIVYMIDKEALNRELTVVSIIRSNLIISFFNVPKDKTHLHSWEILEGFPELLSQKLKESFDVGFTIGVGTPIKDYLNLRASYFQANEAIGYANSEENGAVCYYENFMVDQLLGCIPDKQVLEDFARLSIGSLRDYDQEHGTNLVETLEIYFECNANVSIAAKKLFLHRNSLIYRMERIKEILNSDLKNPTELLALQVGLRVQKILEARAEE